MFVRKKNAAVETQEPTSPKVTCMGQVRVRRSSKQAAVKKGRPVKDDAPTRCHCRWIQNALFCSHAVAKIRLKSCQPVWPNCGFFRVGSFRRKETKVSEDSAITESNFRDRFRYESEHADVELEEGEECEERVNANTPKSSTPPKNAFLLTRCRSAPYRSSSLACRFWGSPLRSEETELEDKELAENERPGSKIEPISDQEGRVNAKTKERLGFFKELEDSIRERIGKSENVWELKRNDEGEDSGRPLVLTRCKSEPARTAYRLYSDVNFWKKRRWDFVD